MRAALLVPLTFATACSQLAGLGDYGEAATTPTGTGGSGGLGAGGMGAAGAQPGVALADWTDSFEVVYRFDDPDWAIDSGAGGDQPLSFAPDIAQEDGAAGIPQGTGALALTSLSARTEATGAPFEPNGESLTFGGWFRFDQSVEGPSHPMGMPSSYTLRRNNVLRMRCDFEVSTGISNVDASGADWPSGTWVHAVCRWHAPGETTTSHLSYDGGWAYGEQNGVTFTPQSPTPFALGKLTQASPGMTGLVDEIFLTRQALTDEAIARIHACGIDGARCTCNLDPPDVYADCGRAKPVCSKLPPCDAAAPPTLP